MIKLYKLLIIIFACISCNTNQPLIDIESLQEAPIASSKTAALNFQSQYPRIELLATEDSQDIHQINLHELLVENLTKTENLRLVSPNTKYFKDNPQDLAPIYPETDFQIQIADLQIEPNIKTATCQNDISLKFTVNVQSTMFQQIAAKLYLHSFVKDNPHCLPIDSLTSQLLNTASQISSLNISYLLIKRDIITNHLQEGEKHFFEVSLSAKNDYKRNNKLIISRLFYDRQTNSFAEPQQISVGLVTNVFGNEAMLIEVPQEDINKIMLGDIITKQTS